MMTSPVLDTVEVFVGLFSMGLALITLVLTLSVETAVLNRRGWGSIGYAFVTAIATNVASIIIAVLGISAVREAALWLIDSAPAPSQASYEVSEIYYALERMNFGCLVLFLFVNYALTSVVEWGVLLVMNRKGLERRAVWRLALVTNLYTYLFAGPAFGIVLLSFHEYG